MCLLFVSVRQGASKHPKNFLVAQSSLVSVKLQMPGMVCIKRFGAERGLAFSVMVLKRIQDIADTPLGSSRVMRCLIILFFPCVL